MVVEGLARLPLLGQRIDSHHVSLQEIILVLDLIGNQILKLLHLDLDYDIVDLLLIRICGC